MNKKKLSIFIIGILIFILTYYLISPIFNSKELNDIVSSSGSIISQAQFKASAHAVAGKAIIVEEGKNKILRFENFETVNGPNLHIYLATDKSASDFIDLGKIKATKGNVNYEIPSNIDLEKYDTILVWCVPFKVLFSYAEL